MVVRPRCRARVGCCQYYEAGYPKGCPASLFLRISASFFATTYRLARRISNRGNLQAPLSATQTWQFAALNFYTQFLADSRTRQFIASIMSPDIRKDVRLLCFCGYPQVFLQQPIDSHDESRTGEICKRPYPLRKLDSLLRSTFIRSSWRTRSLGFARAKSALFSPFG